MIFLLPLPLGWWLWLSLSLLSLSLLSLSLSLSLSLYIWPCHGSDGQSPVSRRGPPTATRGTQTGAWHSDTNPHPSVLQFSRSSLTTQLLHTQAAASRRTNGRSLERFQNNVFTKFRECFHFLSLRSRPGLRSSPPKCTWRQSVTLFLGKANRCVLNIPVTKTNVNRV